MYFIPFNVSMRRMWEYWRCNVPSKHLKSDDCKYFRFYESIVCHSFKFHPMCYKSESPVQKWKSFPNNAFTFVRIIQVISNRIRQWSLSMDDFINLTNWRNLQFDLRMLNGMPMPRKISKYTDLWMYTLYKNDNRLLDCQKCFVNLEQNDSFHMHCIARWIVV